MEIKAADPVYNVVISRGNIQIRRLIFTETTVKWAHMMKPIHRTNVLNIIAQYRTRYGFNGSQQYEQQCYLTRGDFNVLAVIYRRYNEEFQERLDGDELKELIVGMQELTAHEQYIEDLVSSHKSNLNDSNFHIVTEEQGEAL